VEDQAMTVETVETVKVKAALAAKIKAKVASGSYPDADAVIREAMDLLEERDRKHEWLLAALAEGERGPFHEFTPERMAQIRRRAQENARNGKPISDAVTP
jgi:putative addiction module CopG family antidote